MAKKNKQKLAQPSKEHAEELKASLTKYNDSFTTLLNLVPAKYYLTHDDEEDTGNANTKQTRKAKRKALQDAAKDKMEASLAKRAAKKAKYDPSTPRTVTEIQAAREKHKEMKERRQTDAIFLKGFDFEDNSMQTNGAPGNDSESDSANEMDFVGSDDDTPAGGASATSTAARPSIAELRANLQARKAGSTTGSTVNGDESVADAEGTSEGKEALLAERKRQSELRERRRKSTKARIRKEKEEGTSSSFKGKQKESMSALPLAESSGKPPKMSDIKKQLKKEGKRQFFNFDTEGETSTKKEVENAPAPSVSIPEASSAVVPHASTSAAPAPSSSIAFSSLDFAASSALNEVDAPKLSKKQREALGKNTKLGLTSHNPTVALSALNKRTEFLSKLTPEARERAEEKDKWERMAMRAEGTKVYDDEAKLKKMLKKKEKSKDKSRKDWADRKETIQKTQAHTAKKREENINARLQQKKDKKMGVKPSKSVGKQNAKKKGRPGFEGKGGSKKK